MLRNNFFWLAVCVGLVALAMRYSPRREAKPLHARIAEKVVASPAAPLPAPIAAPVETVTIEPSAPAVAPEPVGEVEAVRARAARSAPVVLTLEMRQDKAARKVEANFGELFRQLTAKGVDPSVLRQMLFEREMMWTAGLSTNAMAEAGRAQMAAIKRAVGKAMFDDYSHYGANLPERLVANDFARRLEGTSDALTEEQREWFIVTLHTTRAPDGVRYLATARPWADEFRELVRLIPDSAVEALRPGLTPGQMEVFRAIQRGQRRLPATVTTR